MSYVQTILAAQSELRSHASILWIQYLQERNITEATKILNRWNDVMQKVIQLGSELQMSIHPSLLTIVQN